MTQRLTAIFENGVLRPLQPVEGLAERALVDVTLVAAATLTATGILDCAGTLPDKDAAEMLKIIEEEFERVSSSW